MSAATATSAASSSISVVIPAYNEEGYLAATLDGLRRSADALGRGAVEVLVVDNASTDRTAAVARELGAEVVAEPVHNIARVRNAGARAARGAVLVFIDADTLVPAALLRRIAEVMTDPACIGGAVDTDYRPASAAVRFYLGLWRMLGTAAGMAQGAAQFCRREAHAALGGYDETLFMGEDVDFHWRLRRLARATGRRVCGITDLRVIPSCRRFDCWPLWRTLLWTNPLAALLFRRRPTFWGGWYGAAPR